MYSFTWEDADSVGSTITANRQLKQHTQSPVRSLPDSDGFHLVTYSTQPKVTHDTRYPQGHLPTATPRIDNTLPSPKKWIQSKLGFLVITVQHAQQTTVPTKVLTVPDVQWEMLCIPEWTDAMNSPSLVNTTVKMSQPAQSDQGRHPNFEPNSYSCLSVDDEEPSVEISDTIVTLPHVPTRYPETTQSTTVKSTAPGTATSTT